MFASAGLYFTSDYIADQHNNESQLYWFCELEEKCGLFT